MRRRTEASPAPKLNSLYFASPSATNNSWCWSMRTGTHAVLPDESDSPARYFCFFFFFLSPSTRKDTSYSLKDESSFPSTLDASRRMSSMSTSVCSRRVDFLPAKCLLMKEGLVTGGRVLWIPKYLVGLEALGDRSTASFVIST